jgi:hypothetical protein
VNVVEDVGVKGVWTSVLGAVRVLAITSNVKYEVS